MDHGLSYTHLDQEIFVDFLDKNCKEIIKIIEMVKADPTNLNIRVDLTQGQILDLIPKRTFLDEYYSGEDCEILTLDNFSQDTLEHYIPATVFQGISSLKLRNFSEISDDYFIPLINSSLKFFSLFNCSGFFGLPVLPVEELTLDSLDQDFYPFSLKDFPNLKKIIMYNIPFSRIADLLPETIQSLDLYSDSPCSNLSVFDQKLTNPNQIIDLNVDYCQYLTDLHPFENCYRISAKGCTNLTVESILHLNCAYLDLTGCHFDLETFCLIGEFLSLKGKLIEMIDMDLGMGVIWRVDRNRRQCCFSSLHELQFTS